MKLHGPPVPRRIRAMVAALPRHMRAGQHGAFPEDYPLLWVVVDADKVAAYATAYETEARVLSLRGCQVARQYRGRGLQRRLLRVRLAYARRHGYRTVRTYVATDNLPSLRNVLGAGLIPARVADGWLTLEMTI